MRSALVAVAMVGALVGAVAAAWLLLRDPTNASVSRATPDRSTEDVAQGPVLEAGGKAVLSAPRGTLAIRGKVRRPNGNPAVGARVTAALDQVGEVTRATVAADGTYAFTGLSKALHRVEALLVEGEAEYGTSGWVTAGVDDHDLTLSLQPRTLEFRVLTPQGEPVPRFQARLVRTKGNESLGPRAEGRIQLRVGMGVGDGTVADVAGCFLEVWNARDLEDRDLGLSPARAGPFAGTEREVEVRLRPGPTIEGRVVGPDGPVAEALLLSLEVAKPKGDGLDLDEIFAQFLPPALQGGEPRPPPALRPSFEGIDAETRTDAEGAFRIAFLGTEAAHTLGVTPPKGFLRPAPVHVRPGDAALEIVLKASVKVRITVLGPDGEPRRGAQVLASPDGASEARGEEVTDASGVAELIDLDPGLSYSLRIDPQRPNWPRHVPDALRQDLPAEERADPEPVGPVAAKHTVPQWRPADTTVRLRRAYAVAGVVLDTTDRPVEGRRVTLRLDADIESETTDADGRFRFEGLPSGKALLAAWNDVAHGVNENPLELLQGPPPAPPPPKPNEAEVQIAGDVSGVVLHVPVTLAVTLRLAITKTEAPRKPADLLAGLFGVMGSNFVKVLVRQGDRWEHASTEFVNPFEGMGEKERRIEVKGLAPGGRYAAWMPPVDGQYVYVEFAAEAGSVVLDRRNGGSVSGRVLDLPTGTPFALVSVRDGQGREVEDVKTDREGRFEIRGLPPAEWRVRAQYRTPGGPPLEAEGRASTGGSVDLRLVPGSRPAAEVETVAEVDEVEVPGK